MSLDKKQTHHEQIQCKRQSESMYMVAYVSI